MKLHAATPTNSKAPAAVQLDGHLIVLDEGAEPTVVEVDAGGEASQPPAEVQVQEWLDAVALCFALPERQEGRRWFDV